jgi:hydroxyethylthiazole kinase-like uncharacterized protein yjeF
MGEIETWRGPELLTTVQMRAVEDWAMRFGGVTGLELMERAGRGVVDAVFAEWPDLAAAPHTALVLCGPGNNGGDGFVIARLLKGWGWDVDVFLHGDPEKLPPDARTNHDRWREMGDVLPLKVLDWGASGPLPVISAGFADDMTGEGGLEDSTDDVTGERVLEDCFWDVAFDAMFGTGLTRPLEPVAARAKALLEIRARGDRARTVAVDIPSGICADSGRRLYAHDAFTGRFIRPEGVDLTVTFERRKLGHMLADGPLLCRRLVVAPLGIRRESGDPLDNPKGHVTEQAGCLPHCLSKGIDAHKYHHGHALILSGPFGRTGAARLAARAALRVGAGLVTVAAPEDAMAECAAQLTAIMLRRVDGAEALGEMLRDARMNAVVLGPGLGIGRRTRDLVAVALEATRPDEGLWPRRGVVLDADALSSFAEAPEDLFAMLHEGCVLTPHGGEFARLFPDLAERLAEPPARGPAYSKVDATRAAAERAGCAVLYKGMDTVIAAPSTYTIVNVAAYDRAAPWLATAGSGDVLAGLIAGLMARGLTSAHAAETAAWLHVEAAREAGPGMIAEDLPEAVPTVLRRVLGSGG